VNITSRRESLKKFYVPFGWLLSKANAPPNLITAGAIFWGTLSGILYYQGHPVLGALALLISGILDLCDGYVAVVNQKATKFGAVFDWIADKWVDGIVLGAVGLRYAGDWIAIVAVVSSLLHTFIKPVAYAEIGYAQRDYGKIKDPLESVGFFGRPETLIVLFFSSILYPFNHSSLNYGIKMITLLTLISLGTRIAYLYKNYCEEEE
jgi:phosphatidylglycerophosphate synthase